MKKDSVILGDDEIIEDVDNSLYGGEPIVILEFAVVGQSPLSDISC